MKKLVWLLLPLALIGADKKKTSSKATTAPAAQAAPAPAAVTVPPDATEIAPRVWRHTDKAGKTWIYRQTPFGLSKVEDQSGNIAAAQAAAPPKADVKTVDLGDAVRFEKPNPMGTTVWTRKKSELTADEKSWFEKSKPAAGSDAAVGK